MTDSDLIAEKTEQAADVLAEQNVDCWLTFCRETTEIHEPCLPFLLGFDVVWPTAIVVSKEGRSAVVVGRHDAPNARELPHEVYPYGESLEDPLLDLKEMVLLTENRTEWLTNPQEAFRYSRRRNGK